MENHEIKFSTVSPDGQVVPQRSIHRADIMRCPHTIFDYRHYRDDGTCRCDDQAEALMAEWGYRWDGTGWVA